MSGTTYQCTAKSYMFCVLGATPRCPTKKESKMRLSKKETKKLTKVLEKLDKRTEKMNIATARVNDAIDDVWTLLEEMTGETFMEPIKIS